MAKPELLRIQWLTAAVDGWLGLLTGVGVSFVIITIYVFYAGLTAAQRAQMLGRMQRIIALPG